MNPSRESGAKVKAIPVSGEMAARAVLFAALTGMGAIMRIPLSPVPVTMQVFFVLLGGMALGPVWGPASQVIYLAMGLCGAPFFAAPPHAGPAALFGPTGGYLWGFVLAAGVAGLATRSARGRTSGSLQSWIVPLLCGLAGLAVIYLCGVSWLGAWLAAQGKSASLAFSLGVKPFIAVDLAKTAAACAVYAAISRGTRPVWPTR